jgi:hypothetical protein
VKSRDGGLKLVLAGPSHRPGATKRAIKPSDAFRDLILVPEGAVLIVEEHQVASMVNASGSPGIM